MKTRRRDCHHVCEALVNRMSAAIGLLLLLPVFAGVALVIICTDGRPVFFTQVRIGRKGRPFHIWKFRTMAATGDGALITASGDPRITRVGSFLRRFKVDELPQLFNVLKGEMSLIGPRPEVPEYVDRNAPVWKALLSVRPGITDPAALMYRNEEGLLGCCDSPAEYYRNRVLPKKLLISLRYLRSRSLATDLKVLLLTAGCSIFGTSPDSGSFGRLFKGEATHR